jgi:hypothetical protein
MVMVELKRFNNEGMKQFSEFINETRAKEKNKTGALPYPNLHLEHNLLDNDFSSVEEIDSSIEFKNRLEMGEYLINQCPSIKEKMDDYYIWSWIAALYFNQLRGRKGKRVETQRNEQFIPDSYVRRTPRKNLDYRHSVRSPCWHILNFKKEEDLLKFLFTGRPNYAAGDPIENIGSRLMILRSKNIRNTIFKLYKDKDTKEVKRGAFSEMDPKNRKSVSGKGGARRFLTPLLPRIKKSFDVEIMNPEQIVNVSSPEIHNSKWAK